MALQPVPVFMREYDLLLFPWSCGLSEGNVLLLGLLWGVGSLCGVVWKEEVLAIMETQSFEDCEGSDSAASLLSGPLRWHKQLLTLYLDLP